MTTGATHQRYSKTEASKAIAAIKREIKRLTKLIPSGPGLFTVGLKVKLIGLKDSDFTVYIPKIVLRGILNTAIESQKRKISDIKRYTRK